MNLPQNMNLERDPQAQLCITNKHQGVINCHIHSLRV